MRIKIKFSLVKVDTVLRDFGMAMGKFQVSDLSGNDVGYRVRMESGVTVKQQASGAPTRERYACHEYVVSCR